MPLRSPRERAIQTLSYEAGGLLLAEPVHALVSGGSAGGSVLLLASLAVAVMIWPPLHNTAFDWLRPMAGVDI